MAWDLIMVTVQITVSWPELNVEGLCIYSPANSVKICLFIFFFMHLTKYILLLDSNLAHIFESAKKLGTFLVYETNMQ